jgi:hypothetical protein
MMLRAYAMTADENGRFQEAAASYEASLLSDPTDVEATVNLAVLYWRAAGCSCAASGSLPREFLMHARERLRELLELAGERFADRAEIRFWNRYIAAADAGKALASSECRRSWCFPIAPAWKQSLRQCDCSSTTPSSPPPAAAM